MSFSKEFTNMLRMLSQIHSLDGKICDYWQTGRAVNLSEPFNIGNSSTRPFDFDSEIKPRLPEPGYLLDLNANGFLLTLSRVNTNENIVEFWSFVP